ncbi:ArsR family transcriptional regulator [Microbacterium sp. BWT-B31]|uniref:ArsR family transcriptional regulator n=1 Tax=Microbacterium sp. BWT-B31 TaxID=3232072 RepID=UPI0035287CA0
MILLGADELSLTDIAARAELAYPTAHREVARLLDAGILVERNVGPTRLLSANPDSALVPPLWDILQIVAGPVILLSRELARIDGIESVFLYGSFAARLRGVDGPEPNDIDVMVIGTPDAELVYQACDRIEESVHRPVNATILTRAESAIDSGFLDRVRSNPTVPIIGDLPWP